MTSFLLRSYPPAPNLFGRPAICLTGQFLLPVALLPLLATSLR